MTLKPMTFTKLSEIRTAAKVLSEMDMINRMPTDTEVDAIAFASLALPKLVSVLDFLRSTLNEDWIIEACMLGGIEVDN